MTDVKNQKVIGVGNTAAVYELDKGRVLKLFNKSYSKKTIEEEFKKAKAVNDLDFPKPKAYELVLFQDQIGIVYDKVEGESLLDWLMRTGDVKGCAVYMADLHKLILKNNIRTVPSYKEFLKANIIKGLSDNSKKLEELLKILDKLPDDFTLCHGDFHPGNILIDNGRTSVIDFANICHGPYLYDIARTVFLIEYTPVPKEVENKEGLLQLKKSLADLYLMEMDVSREEIKDYLLVIGVARRGECPREYCNCD